MMNVDTIAAISTAPGEAGIAIIRISGPKSFKIADQVFKCAGDCPSKRQSYTMIHGHVETDEGVIDEALLLVMRAPHSYTREDVVELQGHGGRISGQRILRCVVDAGARLAEPGEFTKRAFLNGRIDLAQAEAVLDLIKAQTDRSAQAALEQLEGSLSFGINAMYDNLIQINADMEAALDFSEDDLRPEILPGCHKALANIHTQIKSMLNTWEEGHILREGALVVIAGKPNVGKSTLLNALLGKSRVIVSPTPGTTRDTIEEGFVLTGIPLRLVDTAGLRESQSDIEREGVMRTHEHIANADIYLYVIDASERLAQDDIENVGKLKTSRTVVILNKTDIGQLIQPLGLQGVRTVSAALINGIGVDEIKAQMKACLEKITSRSPHAVISERHRQILLRASEEVKQAIVLVTSMNEDVLVLASARIRAALEELGQITGRTYQDELLDSIFSRFCVGK